MLIFATELLDIRYLSTQQSLNRAPASTPQYNVENAKPGHARREGTLFAIIRPIYTRALLIT